MRFAGQKGLQPDAAGGSQPTRSAQSTNHPVSNWQCFNPAPVAVFYIGDTGSVLSRRQQPVGLTLKTWSQGFSVDAGQPSSSGGAVKNPQSPEQQTRKQQLQRQLAQRLTDKRPPERDLDLG